MSNFQYKNPLSPIQVLGAQSVSRTSTFGTNFSILGTGGYMEVYGLTDLNFVIPVGQTGFIEFSGNTIPIEFNKGTGTAFSPDVVTLNSDNMSSGRRRLGMLVYVYETNKIYRHTIENYGGLWSAATDASGVGGPTVVISDFGTTVKNNSVAGQNLINAWTGSTIEGVDGYTNLNATWRELVTGSGGTSTADTFVTGFTLSSNTITLTQNRTDQYSSFTISLSAYTGSSSTTGAFLPLSGGTVTGDTIFQSGLTANTLNVTGDTLLSGLTAATISATTYYNYPDTFVTGFTLSSNTITLSQNRTDQYSAFTISLSAYTGTSISGLYLPLSGGTVTGNTIFQSGLTANTLNVTGDTLLSGLTASTISATTYQNVNAVTGGSYSNGTITLSGTGNFAASISGFPTTFINDYLPLSGGTVTGNTIFNSGLTANTLNVTGNTILSGLTAETISATTYYNYPDTFVTGFTLSSNTITLTQNRTDGYSSFTISLSAYTGSSSTTSGEYLPLSGGTVTGNTFFTSGLSVNYVDFDTTPTVPSPTGGTLYYDSNENALSYKPITPSNGVTVNLGQESLIRIYNNLGVQINNGQALHITGATSGAPTVSLAIATGGSAKQFQISGIATHDIPSSSYGFMTVFGVVRDINLTGFSVGEQVYLSQTVAGDFASYSDLFYTGRTCEVGHVIDNSSNGKLSVALLNEIEGTIITTLENNILTANNSSTGIFQFSGLSIDTPSGTTFSVSQVEGWIIDNVTVPDNPTIQLIIYSGSSGNTSLYYSSATETYILLTSASTITQQTSFPTPQQRRQNLYLGKFGHGNKEFLINAFNEPDSVLSPLSQLRDMFTPIKLINSGVIPSDNGANLTFNTSAGILYGLGIGYVTNKLNPNSLSVSGQSPTTFQYRTQTGGTATNRTTIDPNNYDLNGVVTPIGSTKATNQRIYLLQNGQIRIQYGQTEYNTLTAAIAAVQKEEFVTFPNFVDNAILIGVLSVIRNASSLIDPNDAQFFVVSKFGEVVGAAGGTSTTTLQQAYNNSVTPEIVTNSAEGALTIQNGTGNADNVTNLLEGKNSGTTTTSFIRADGLISGNTVSTPSFTANANGMTATTVSATTYYGVNAATGGTYSNGTITLAGTGTLGTITGLGGSGGGQLYYLNLSVAQNGYQEFSPIPTTAAQQTTGTSISSGVTSTLASFLTPPTYPNTNQLPGGIWSFYLHTYKDVVGSSFNTYVQVYKRTSGGTETLLFTTDPSTVTGVSPNPVMQITDAYYSGTSLNTSDRILVVVKGVNTNTATHTLTLVTEGSQYYSYATTPFGAGTPNYTTGGTYNASSGILTFTRTDGNSYTAGTFSYVTAVTESANVITVTSNGGSPSTYTMDAVTGGTYNGTTGVITLSGTGSVNGNQITGFSTGGGGGGGLTWNNATTTQSASVDNGYVGTATTLTTITLPSTAAFGSIVEVVGTGTGLWRISQNVNQFINFGVATTTTGTGGYLSATSQYDCVKLLCTSADTAFVVTSAIGNIFYI